MILGWEAVDSQQSYSSQFNCLVKSLDTCKLVCRFFTNLQIGYRHVVDATLQEEACSLASLLISVTSKGALTSMKKMGKGSLDPESIFEMMEVRSFEPLMMILNYTGRTKTSVYEKLQ